MRLTPLLSGAFLALSLAAAPSVAAPPPAAAPPSARDAARARAEEGLKLFGADRFAPALEAFREADALYHAPTLLLYEARCLRKLGRLLAARALYAKVLAERPPADAPRPFLEAQRDAAEEMERVRAAIPVLVPVVTGPAAADAVVIVDGAPLRAASIELDPGAHTLVVTVGSSPPITRLVQLAEGALERVEIALAPPTTTPPPPSTAPIPPGTAPAPPRVPDRPPGSLWPAGAAFGVAAGALVVGAVTGAVSLARVSAVRAHCQADQCPVAYQGDAQRAALLGNVSTAMFVTAGVGVAAGTVLVLVQGRF